MAPHPIPPPDAFGVTRATDLPLYWCTYGTPGAERLVVLHGGPGAHHDYLLPQMLELRNMGSARSGYELLFYDQRGGGRSKTGDNRDEITWQTQTRDLGAVLSELAPDRPTIVGYSWGALLAMLYATEAETHPERPAAGALVLIDPAAISEHYRGQFEREFSRRQSSPEVERMRAALADSRLRERDLEAYRQRNFELSVAGYFADPKAAQNLTPFRVTARVQQSIWHSLGDFDLVADGRLASIRVPTLIVHGRQDPIPLESSEAAARAMGARLVVLDDCGHVPYVEQPAALFAAIAEFLDSSAGRAA